MIIKTFNADSMAAGLKLVRSELGKDAVVLKSREIPGGSANGRVEITACTEKPLPTPATPVKTASTATRPSVKPFTPQQVTNRLQATTVVPSADPVAQKLEQIEAKLNRLAAFPELMTGNTKFEPLRSALRNVDVPSAVIDELLGSIEPSHDLSNATAALRSILTEKLSNLISGAIELKPGDRVLFFGPAGAGKTSALGKLAAGLVFQQKQKVTLVSLDAMKVGASEEIQSYGDIIGSPVLTDDTASSTESDTITLIDTSALPRQTDQLATLRNHLETLQPNYRFAVVSAVMRSDDIAEFAKTINEVAPTHVILTGLDLTDRWGGLFAACASTGKQLLYAANTPGGIGALMTPDTALFVKKLLTTEESRG
jgi:flagellar biosynthesis protein FlhF